MCIDTIVSPFARSLGLPSLTKSSFVFWISSLSLQKLLGRMGESTKIPTSTKSFLHKNGTHHCLELDLAIRTLDHDIGVGIGPDLGLAVRKSAFGTKTTRSGFGEILAKRGFVPAPHGKGLGRPRPEMFDAHIL